MLKSECNTKVIERVIGNAAVKKFGRGKAKLVFDHGQWWVLVYDKTEDQERIFSVVDAEGPGSIDGFYFEGV